MFCVDLRINCLFFPVFNITGLVFVTETEYVYCFVRSDSFIQGVSGGIVNILDGGSMDYSE